MAQDLVLDIFLRAHDEFSGIFGRMGTGAHGLSGAIGGLASALGGLAGGVLVGAVKDAAHFESVTQALANNTNMGAKGLDAMRDASLKLQAATGQDAERIAEGYMHIANHAYEGAAAMNIATAAAKNAAATNGDVAEDANVLAGILREMNVSQTDLARHTELATRTMDVLHNAVANSNWTMKQFAEGSKMAFAQAGLYGVPISQVSAQLAVLSEHGFPDARKASVNWAGMLRSLEFPTDKALKGMQALSRVTGVDLVADIGKLRKDGAYLPQFLADIQKAASSPEAIKAYGSQAAALHAIMSQSSYRAALEALTRNRDEYLKVSSVTGAAQAGKTMPGMVGTNEAFAAQQKTLNGMLGDLKGSLHSVFTTIGLALIPILEKLLRAAMPIIQHIATWISHHQKLTAEILAGVAVAGTLIGALMMLAPVLGLVFSQAGAIAVGFGVAIAGMILFATHTQEIKDFLGGIWSKIADEAGQLWSWLTGIWNGITGDTMLLWENMGSWLNTTWTGIVSGANDIWSKIIAFFKDVWNKDIAAPWNKFWDDRGKDLNKWWTGIKDDATRTWNNITGFFGGLWDGISGAWTTTWNTIKGAVEGIWTNVSNDAQHWWTTATHFVTTLWDGISGAWNNTWVTIKNKVHEKWTDITGQVHRVWDGAKNAVTNLWGGVTGAWTRTWGTITNFVNGLHLGDKGHSILAGAKSAVEALWGNVTVAWTSAWDGIKHTLVLKWTDLKNTAYDWGGKIVHGIGDGIGHAVSALTSLGGAVGTAGSSIFDTLGTMATNVGTWFDQNLIQPAKQWGKNIIQALVDGIKSAYHKVEHAFSELMQAIRDFHPSSPAKRGPLQTLPTYTWIADQMLKALPAVHAASAQIVAAMPGGTKTLGLAATRAGVLSGGIGAAGTASSLAGVTGATGARPVVNLNLGGITVQGGTFTDKKGVSDLAEKVSEEIMHKVRMQGGLLPQM